MKNIILILLLLASIDVQSQVPVYNGGVDDGYAFDCYDQNYVPVFGMYTGGVEDGFSVSCYQQSFSYGTTFPFLGGNNDNSYLSYGCYSQLPHQNALTFLGGINDGTDAFCFEQFSPNNPLTFLGSVDDGYAFDCFYQGLTPPELGMYTGGINDGNDLSCFTQQNNLSFDIYYGGIVNSTPIDCYEQMNLSSTIVFQGGFSSTENPVSCFEQLDYLILVALPIELLAFNAICTDGQVDLSWETSTEINSDYFEVQKSTDLLDWETVTFVTAAGNSFFKQTYSTIDMEPSRQISYYRLKSVDFSGKFDYSPIRSVNCNENGLRPEILAYPNPVSEKLNIQFSNFISNECMVQIFNTKGQLVYSEAVQLQNGEGLYEIQRTPKMISGYYMLVTRPIQSNNSNTIPEIISQKLIFQ